MFSWNLSPVVSDRVSERVSGTWERERFEELTEILNKTDYTSEWFSRAIDVHRAAHDF